MDVAELSTLVSSIYSASLSAAEWPAVMAALGHLFGSHSGAVIVRTDPAGGAPTLLGSQERKASVDDYTQHWSVPPDAGPDRSRSVRGGERASVDIIQGSLRLPANGIATDEVLVDKANLEKTDFYHTHLKQFDFYHAVAANLWKTRDSSGLLSISRSQQLGSFSPDEIRILQLVQPHLQQALRSSERLAWADLAGLRQEGGCESLGHATLLLNDAGRCLYVSPAAQRLLDAEAGLKLRNARLVAGDLGSQARLDEALAHSLAAHTVIASGADVLISHEGRASLIATVTPIADRHTWFTAQRPWAAVLLVHIDQRPTPAAATLTSLFGMTASEAQVARGIARGHDIRQVALDLGLTIETTRQYLSRAYAKSGTRRQNDLTRLLVMIANR